MSEHVYPVPADNRQLGDLLTPFLEETVTEKGLTPDEHFMVVLFGDDASDHREEVVDHIKNTGSVARKSHELNQLSIVSIDEKRLNTFTTSLLYALLETDPNQPVHETLRGDYIADEDKRKVDYYLPRLIETVEDSLAEESRLFEENLNSLFPVELEAQQPRDMNERMNKDVVTDQTILDFMLLAAASTEDKTGVECLLRFIREEKIDDSEMLSGGSGGVAGYSRIISISYLITKKNFNSEFRTARELYDQGATSGLLRLLDDTEEISPRPETDIDTTATDEEDESPLETFYNIEQRVERLITSQFPGNATQVAERLLKTINGTRLIQNNSDVVRSTYQSQKKALQSELSRLRGELTSLEAQGDEFDDTKIAVDTAEPDPYAQIIELVDDTNSLIAKFIFGFDRTSRTSVFTTLEYKLKQYRETLSDHRIRIDELLGEIEVLESRCNQEVDNLKANYDRLEATSIETNVPDRERMIGNLEEAWEEEIVKLQYELPVLDFVDEADSLEARLDDWEKQISNCRLQLDELCEPIEQLEQTVEKLERIEEKRASVRTTLSEIDAIMEDR